MANTNQLTENTLKIPVIIEVEFSEFSPSILHPTALGFEISGPVLDRLNDALGELEGLQLTNSEAWHFASKVKSAYVALS